MGKIQLDIPKELHKKLKSRCALEGKSQKSKILELIAQWIKKGGE